MNPWFQFKRVQMNYNFQDERTDNHKECAMYLVTNREIVGKSDTVDLLGERPNRKGPNELRILRARRSGRRWKLELLPDLLTQDEKKTLGLPLDETFYASHKAAIETIERARRQKKHILFFVHGFNNDVDSVLTRAAALERRYGLIVVPFSWPANGGGIKGITSYRSDKRDAYTSKGALDRTLGIMQDHLTRITGLARDQLWKEAEKKHPNDGEKRNALYTALLEKLCPITINMMAHSMGNYLFKQVMNSSASEGSGLLFDNVVLVAADVNNVDHRVWVDRIRARRRVIITINERDHALAVSRAKAGDEQLARLGHSLNDLESRCAVYINFTGAKAVGTSHAYFEGETVEKNTRIRTFFREAFRGVDAERRLTYKASRNVYEFD